jgi:hypothetical protein
VSWLAAGLEGLDDKHAAATVGARLGDWLGGRRIDLGGFFEGRGGQAQEFACSRDRLGAIAAACPERSPVLDSPEKAIQGLRR